MMGEKSKISCIELEEMELLVDLNEPDQQSDLPNLNTTKLTKIMNVTESMPPSKRKCIHGKADNGYHCVACHGRGICAHNRRRNCCKQCGGAGICKHNRYRSQCRECGGSLYCIHDREKFYCRDCGGAGVCIHLRQRRTCKECGGSALCVHGREKGRCKFCGGASICIHQRQKRFCKDCGGSAVCVHGKSKYQCKECKKIKAEKLVPTKSKETRKRPVNSSSEFEDD